MATRAARAPRASAHVGAENAPAASSYAKGVHANSRLGGRFGAQPQGVGTRPGRAGVPLRDITNTTGARQTGKVEKRPLSTQTASVATRPGGLPLQSLIHRNVPLVAPPAKREQLDKTEPRLELELSATDNLMVVDNGRAEPAPPTSEPVPMDVEEKDAEMKDARPLSRAASVAAPSVAPHATLHSAPRDIEPLSPLQSRSEDDDSVAEYVPDIVEKLYSEEATGMPWANYMDMQPDVNSRMRAILVDWLIEVHMKFRLRPETLFLTINLIDRYLTRMPVTRKRLQLVGVVAMFIAAKFEEVDPPSAGSFAYITDNAYTKDDIFKMECTVLTALGFKIVVPTSVHFFEYLLRACRCDDLQREVAQYVLELALPDLKMLRHEPSHLVSAALLLCNELLGRRPAWPPQMSRLSRHSEQALRGCAAELRNLLEAAPGSNLQAVRKKYSQQTHLAVAKMSFSRPHLG